MVEEADDASLVLTRDDVVIALRADDAPDALLTDGRHHPETLHSFASLHRARSHASLPHSASRSYGGDTAFHSREEVAVDCRKLREPGCNRLGKMPEKDSASKEPHEADRLPLAPRALYSSGVSSAARRSGRALEQRSPTTCVDGCSARLSERTSGRVCLLC